eukprot:COSAG01_NODE_2027_length_8600_cov_3.986356_12_plen_78_part_00
MRKWELRLAMDRLGLGLSADQHERLLKTLDTDDGGLVEFQEFEWFMLGGAFRIMRLSAPPWMMIYPCGGCVSLACGY